jgi:HEAT repeat protein
MPKSKKSPKQNTPRAKPATTQKVIHFLELCAERKTSIWLQGRNGLRKLGSKAIPSLIAILTGRDPVARNNDSLRIQAASYMYGNQIADRAVARALIEALNDPSPGVRSMSSQALSCVAPAAGVRIPDRAIASVVNGLANSPRGFRYGAAMAVNEMACVVKSRAAAAVPALIDTLSNRDGETRCAALASLRHIGAPAASAAPSLLRVLEADPHGGVRRSAAHGLWEIGARPAMAVPALILALRDKNTAVRQAAAEALGTYGRAARTAIPSLEAVLEDRPAVRKSATIALEQIRSGRRHRSPVR